MPECPADPAAARPDIDFAPVPVRFRRDGWTVDRQVAFIETLAVTGCVRHAAAAAGMSVRSAYRLAARADAADFAEAWDCAVAIAVRSLTALALRYATEGMVETIWKDGEIVAERRRPSERILIFLLTHLDPARLAARRPAPVENPDGDPDPASWPRRRLPELFGEFEDIELEAEDTPDAEEAAPRAPAHVEAGP